MNEIDTPADLRGDAEVLEDAAAILRKRFEGTGKYDQTASAVRSAGIELIHRSRHPSRQKLRGGAQYTPPPAPEGTEVAP